jgi:hypothetical protein
MATYGYSAGYQGGGPQAVPSGYIEAYSQAGRNIGAGMQQIGNAIGESLARYGQNKAENEFLQTRLESLAPYLNTVAQSGNIMDKNSPESKLLGDIEKFSSMSIPQKKATLLNAEFFLDRADKQRARELQDIQAEAARFNLQTAQGAEARRLGLEQAISQVAQLPTTQEVTVPAPPAIISSSLMLPAEQQPYTPFYQVQQIPGGTIQQPPAPQMPQAPTFGGMRFGGADQYTMGLGRNIMPIPAGTNRSQFTPSAQVQAAQPSGIAPIPQREVPAFESQPSSPRPPRRSPSAIRNASSKRSTCSSAWVLRSILTPSEACWRPPERLGQSRSSPRRCPAASPWCVRTARSTSYRRQRWSRART